MFNVHQLSSVIETSQDVPPQSTSANVAGAGVDMQGWDGVMFTLNLGAFTGAANVSMYLQEDTQSNYATATNIANAATNTITNANQNVVAVVDVFRPDKRYVRSQVYPQANAVVVGVTATRYRHTGILPPDTRAAFQTVFVQVS